MAGAVDESRQRFASGSGVTSRPSVTTAAVRQARIIGLAATRTIDASARIEAASAACASPVWFSGVSGNW